MAHETLITDLLEDGDTVQYPSADIPVSTKSPEEKFASATISAPTEDLSTSISTVTKKTTRKWKSLFSTDELTVFAMVTIAAFIGMQAPIIDFMRNGVMARALYFGPIPVRALFIGIVFYVLKFTYKYLF